MGGPISIEMDSVPGIDLAKIPKDMRCECEPVTLKDRKKNRLFHHMDGVAETEKTLTILNSSKKKQVGGQIYDLCSKVLVVAHTESCLGGHNDRDQDAHWSPAGADGACD